MERQLRSEKTEEGFNLKKKKRKLTDKIGIFSLKCQASGSFITKAPITKFLRCDCDLSKLNVKKV